MLLAEQLPKGCEVDEQSVGEAADDDAYGAVARHDGAGVVGSMTSDQTHSPVDESLQS